MKKLYLILFIAFSGLLQAYDGTSDWTTVKLIYSPVSGGKPYVIFDGTSLDGCYSNSGAYLPVDNKEASDRVYSTLLAAQMSGKPVRVFFNYKLGVLEYRTLNHRRVFAAMLSLKNYCPSQPVPPIERVLV